MSFGRLWTSDDTARLQRLANAGMTDGEIAVEMNRHRTMIVKKRAQHGIPRGISAAMVAALTRLSMRRRMAIRRRAEA